MTPQQAYEIVRAACVKVQPEIAERRECDCYWCAQRLHNGGGGHYITGRPIRLTDILLAVGEFSVYQFKTELGPTVMRFDDEGHDWSLKNDSLEWHLKNQPETVLWLADLLGN